MSRFIEDTAFLQLESALDTPVDALTILRKQQIQLLFLDIHLPGFNGLELTRTLYAEEGKPAPLVVLMSASDLFAVEGYRVNAVDYLLKPITYEKFLQAALKAQKMLSSVRYDYNDYIFLRVDYELIRVYLRDILYFESFKDYVKVYTQNRSEAIIALTTLRGLEEKIPAASFARIHRSFIVSLDKIESLTKTSVRIGETVIPVTLQYKENLKEFINKWL